MMTHVYLVVPQGVSDHSPAAVCGTRDEATKIAEDLWKRSDGYHGFAIECRRLGKVYETFSLGSTYSPTTTEPPRIEQVNERDVGGY